MRKKIKSALVSVFHKDGLENIIKLLRRNDVKIYSTGGTQKFIEDIGVECTPVESLTGYPSILGGRVKTLHPSVFGGILGRRELDSDKQEMETHHIPPIDLVIVDLYPFEETVQSTNDEAQIIEKIDIGGPSMIRAAAKNFQHVLIVGDRNEYPGLENILDNGNAETTLGERKEFAGRAFERVAHYEVAIAKYFTPGNGTHFLDSVGQPKTMRYGENPHQSGVFFGDLEEIFTRLNGKELSYNNVVDVDAAVQLISEFPKNRENDCVFGIIKHTNVCGIASRKTVFESWKFALAGDPESAFGGVLVTNSEVDDKTANAINEIFFEVLIAPSFSETALEIVRSKKNRILLQLKNQPANKMQYKSLLNGVLVQQVDEGNYTEWNEEGGRESSDQEKKDLAFANIICKHLKSNAIAMVKEMQLIGKGCGQTSRVDALRQAISKAKQFGFDMEGAVIASDAFFPFDDCVRIGHEAGVRAFIQPGGSIRDKDSIAYCKDNGLVMVLTGIRHFRH